ncbi:MAG: hypothetical protein R3229_12890 [Alphaproteobacteria bacterium]|nr:hypothetical protein [Alphaproteobacteria bacterium]
MSYSAELQTFTTWLMAGGGIILVFSLIACSRFIPRSGRNRLSQTIGLIGFWISFYGAFMDHRLAAFW